MLLKRVSKSSSVLQYHLGSLPKDRDGISVSALSFLAMWRGANGDTWRTFNRRANARMSCPDTNDPHAANLQTQLTVGELSLKRAMCVPGVILHTSSITSHRKRSPAISRSEFVRCPSFLEFVLSTACFIWPLQAKHCWFARFTVSHYYSPHPMQGRIRKTNEVRFPHDQFLAWSGVF